ncbi:hypothetical protein [Clostridium neonatale]|nr:hypothetical protein [Clostridium neonatale]
MSYGEQLGALKEKNVWISIVGVMLLNGSIFGVYSYLSEYLSQETGYSISVISIILFAYGMANIIGNALIMLSGVFIIMRIKTQERKQRAIG